MDADLNKDLAHHGVTGMKWGVRRGSSKSKIPASLDSAIASGYKSRSKAGGVKALSNQELQYAVNRMNLEKQFAELKSKNHPSKVKRGQEAIKKALSVVKTVQDLQNAYNSPLGRLIVEQLKR